MKLEDTKAIKGDYDIEAFSKKIQKILEDPVIKFLREELFDQIVELGGDTAHAGFIKALVNKRALEIRDEEIPEIPGGKDIEDIMGYKDPWDEPRVVICDYEEVLTTGKHEGDEFAGFEINRDGSLGGYNDFWRKDAFSQSSTPAPMMSIIDAVRFSEKSRLWVMRASDNLISFIAPAPGMCYTLTPIEGVRFSPTNKDIKEKDWVFVKDFRKNT